MYQGCPRLQDAEVRAALTYFSVMGNVSSLTTRFVCTSVDELKGQGITDPVLLPCFAAVIGKERSFVSLLEVVKGAGAAEAFRAECSEELRQEARTVITGVVNLQVGQEDADGMSPTCILRRARTRRPRLDPVRLRSVLEAMYEARDNAAELRAIHDTFTGACLSAV